MKTLLCVMAHREAQATFDRHLGLWRAHGYPILVMCPTDSPVQTGIQTVLVGKRGHHSDGANARFRTFLKTLLDLEQYDSFFIHEYDSVCLCPKVPEVVLRNRYLWCNRFKNDFADPKFIGTQFLHPPFFMTREVIHAVLKTVGREAIEDHAEHNFYDRWLGLVADKACGTFLPQGYDRLGYSQNTILPAHMDEAKQAVREGARFIHGVKTETVLEGLLGAMFESKPHEAFAV